MEAADVPFFEGCLGLGYFLATLAVCLLGLMQGSMQAKSAEHILSIRSPRLLGIGTGMLGLLCVAAALWFPLGAGGTDSGAGWFFCALSLLLGVPCILLFLNGPLDVSIDFDRRTCQVTRGWAFRLRKWSYPLSAASSVCACSGGESHCVFLVVGGGAGKRFLLERFSVKADAATFAQRVADKLQVAARELPLSRLGVLN